MFKVVREFTCALTGEHVRIVRLPDGVEIAIGEDQDIATIEF